MSCGTSHGVADDQHEASLVSPFAKGGAVAARAFRTGTLFVTSNAIRPRAVSFVRVAM